MSTTHTTPGNEGNIPMAAMSEMQATTTTQPPWATVNYVARCGQRMTFNSLEEALDALAWHLEDEADTAKGKSREKLKEAAEAVRDLLPDPEAMKPEPDPIAAAQAFLDEERQRAQDLLRAEAARMKKETFIKEAYFMPCGILNGIMDRALPVGEESRSQWEEARKRVEKFLEDAGWTVDPGFGPANPAYIRSREPLRQLARLIDDFPLSSLTSHALAVIRYALRWCENTSYNFTSPITSKGQNGIPPEGVLYPRISMELVKVESSRDVPKEWKEPLATA